jgi:hypothetical protein
MSYTLTQLTTAIEDTVQNYEASFVVHIPDFITQTEKDVYNRVQALCARQNSTGAMVTGNRYVAVPTNWLATYTFAVIDATGVYSYLLQKEPDYIREAYPNPTQVTTLGLPQHYALYDINTFVVGPTPDQAYSLEMSYLAYPASLTAGAGSGTTWLSTNYEHVLLYGCLVYAYTYMKGEPELIKQYTDLFNSALTELKQLVDGKNRRDAYRSGSPRVQVT